MLNKISCTTNAGEKVGVCGRSGAGKSSLLTALYRVVELESGSILIDGINIGAIGMHDLRSKLTIVPQEVLADCVCLSRFNLYIRCALRRAAAVVKVYPFTAPSVTAIASALFCEAIS